jgi:hypothetical protein
MNSKVSTLATLAVTAALAAGCDGSGGDANKLVGVSHYASYDPSSLAAEGNTQHHFQDPNTGDNGLTEPLVAHAEAAQIGSPEVVARLHACGKLPYASLGSVLSTRGVSLNANTGKNAAQTAGTLYKSGASALGIASYAGRVPEMVIASTSSMAKMFDIFVAAAPEIQQNLSTSSACSGTSIADANGVFTKDGIACVIGKPANDDYVTLANQAVQQVVAGGGDVSSGVQIAIAALLEAAHSCE